MTSHDKKIEIESDTQEKSLIYKIIKKVFGGVSVKSGGNIKDKKIVEFMYSYNEAHNFYINQDVCELLLKTKTDIHNRMIPFNNIFINMKIKFENKIIYGINLIQTIKPEFREQYTDKIATNIWKKELLKKNIPEIDVELIKKNIKISPKHLDLYVSYIFQDLLNFKLSGFSGFNMNTPYERADISKVFAQKSESNEKEKNPEYSEKEENIMKKNDIEVAKITCGLLDYINNENPKIEIVSIPLQMYEKQNDKGTTIRPRVRYTVKITPNLKKYLNKLKSNNLNFSYSHKFWVRGHWRHFRKEYYKGLCGTKKWIYPYIKGSGILIEKKYEVKK